MPPDEPEDFEEQSLELEDDEREKERELPRPPREAFFANLKTFDQPTK